MAGHRWTEFEIDVLRKNWTKKSASEIGQMFDPPRTRVSVADKANSLGLGFGYQMLMRFPLRKPKKIAKPRERWIRKDIEILIQHWGTIPAREIGKILSEKKTEASVLKKAHRLRLEGEGFRRPMPLAMKIAVQEEAAKQQIVRDELARKRAIWEHQNKCGW